jgi:cellulase/cellobiase CelA1
MILTLSEVIDALAKLDQTATVTHGFGSGHSYRGYYDDAAFTPVEQTTIGEMRKHAIALVNTVQNGYKGGEYTMHENVDAYIAEYGDLGEPITDTHIRMWEEQCNAQDVIVSEGVYNRLRAELEQAQKTIGHLVDDGYTGYADQYRRIASLLHELQSS